MLLQAAAQVTYEELLAQHSRWREYATSCLQSVAAERRPGLISVLDWHGARVCVLKSANAVHASACGLVLSETQRMLLLLSETRRAWIRATLRRCGGDDRVDRVAGALARVLAEPARAIAAARAGFLGGDGDALHCGGCQYDLCPSCSAIDAPAS